MIFGEFDFAKSRGQMHLRLLGIFKDATTKEMEYEKLFLHQETKQALILWEWVREKFRMTAEIKNDTKPSLTISAHVQKDNVK